MSARDNIPLEVRLETEDFAFEELEISELSGHEHISRPFRFELLLTCRDPAGLDAQRVVGAHVSLVFLKHGEEVRRLFGLVSEMTDQLDSETEFYVYRMVIEPRLFRATLVEKQEVVLEATVPEVIQKSLDLLGLGREDVVMRLRGDYPKREFVVQYRETDLAFVSRLAEHLGISFFFEHDSGRDKLIFTDHQDGFRKAEDAERAVFRPRGEKLDVFRLDLTNRLIPSMYVVYDYDYEKPLIELAASLEIQEGYGGGVVEYGPNIKDPKEAAAIVKARAQERLVRAQSCSGKSGVCTLAAGARWVLDDHPRVGRIELLTIEVTHSLRQVALGSGGAELRYENTFRAIPAAMLFRPARVTPRPRIHGVTSGVIEAAPGIDTHLPWIDEHGRYLVRVLFDTVQPGERKASLPIRMAQAHSGPGYGVHYPLRPGVEVLLTFVDGDPDRPLIVGSVPNAITPTPVNDKERSMHRIRTFSGVVVEIDDEA